MKKLLISTALLLSLTTTNAAATQQVENIVISDKADQSGFVCIEVEPGIYYIEFEAMEMDAATGERKKKKWWLWIVYWVITVGGFIILMS